MPRRVGARRQPMWGTDENVASPAPQSQLKSEKKVKLLISSQGCRRQLRIPSAGQQFEAPSSRQAGFEQPVAVMGRVPATLGSEMCVLGLDLGSKRIGLAISDPEARIAFPAGTLASRGRRADIEALRELILERNIARAVVGLPRHMDGRKGNEAIRAEKFAASLALASGITVDLLDERWTSQEAERSLYAQGYNTHRVAEHVDEVAATIILRTYLDLRNSGQPLEDSDS